MEKIKKGEEILLASSFYDNLLKKIFILCFLVIFTQSCSTAVTVVDTTASVAINTVKGVVHYSTCPFTKKVLILVICIISNKYY